VPNKKLYLPILMWLLPLSFFAYQFILRLWPSLMMQQIMGQFAIDATAFGVLASVYYYGYAGMQVPMAILLDKVKVRYVIFSCALICGVATYAFSYTDNWYVALISRFMVGAGSAVGFLGVSKVVSQWFSKENYSKMIGFTFTIGLMGAIYGGKPVSLLVSQYSWQTIATTLALFSMSIGVVALALLRAPKLSLDEKQSKSEFQFSDLKTLLTSKTIWILGIVNLLMVGALEGFVDVWGVSYLMSAYNITQADAAELTSMIFIGMLFGGPILVLLSKYFGNYAVISACGLGMGLLFMQLISGIEYNWYVLAILFILTGVMCCYQVIIMASGCEMIDIKLLGVTIAFLNCMNMFGGSFFHSVIGFFMDKYWSGNLVNGIKSYGIESYNHALMIIPICSIIGAFLILMLGIVSRRRERAALEKA
jgi:MFS family permease